MQSIRLSVLLAAAFALSLLCPFAVFAQKPTEDVLYLKNGWVLRGKITSLPSDGTVKIQTYDRNQFVFSRSEVDSLRQELVFYTRNRSYFYKSHGFSHYTELGALAAKNTSSATNTSAFSFQTVNGYKFNQFFFTGVGIGIDLYATQSVLPLFGSIRGDFSGRNNLIPYYFLDAGYGVNITGEDTNSSPQTNYSGGALFAVGLGMKVIFNNSTGFLLSIGYRSQNTTQQRDFGSGTTTKEEVNYQRVAVRAGFTF